MATPFGERSELGGDQVVDFDHLYAHCIGPAADSASVEVIRADEETLGGFIHRPMYERLLLAEIVLADLTFANANVFYELGVRHAARPRSTILIFADLGNALPFDVAPVRAIPYRIDSEGQCEAPEKLVAILAERLAEAGAGESVDSPLFQLLDDYPGIDLAHDVTEAFKERARLVSGLTVRAYEAALPGRPRAAALAELRDIESELIALPGAEEQVLVSLLLAYRDVEGWSEMVDLVAQMPLGLQRTLSVREQLALALNRREEPGDRRRAITTLEEAIDEHGRSSESLGILGRCYKDRWREKLADGDPGAEDALDRAIDAYGRGFEADPRDFYPGINLLRLLHLRGLVDDLERIRSLGPVLAFGLARRGGLRSEDYWVLATTMELAVLEGDEPLARRAVSAMADTEPASWMWETTAADLAGAGEGTPDWQTELVARLKDYAEEAHG